MTPGDLDTALKYFELALQKEPNYAAAHAGIAMVWACRNQMMIAPTGEAVPKAKAAALRAVELDDTLAEAHYALAGIYTWHDWNMPEAGREWARAAELNPNYPDGLAVYSHYLMIVCRSEEAMAMIDRALDLDPFNVTIHSFYIHDLIFARRYDDAIAEARKTLAMQPDNPAALAGALYAYGAKGMAKETLVDIREAYKGYQMPGFDAARPQRKTCHSRGGKCR